MEKVLEFPAHLQLDEWRILFKRYSLYEFKNFSFFFTYRDCVSGAGDDC